jgi:hypothetical protein
VLVVEVMLFPAPFTTSVPLAVAVTPAPAVASTFKASAVRVALFVWVTVVPPTAPGLSPLMKATTSALLGGLFSVAPPGAS